MLWEGWWREPWGAGWLGRSWPSVQGWFEPRCPQCPRNVPSALEAISRGRCCSVVELSGSFTTAGITPGGVHTAMGTVEQSARGLPVAAPPATPAGGSPQPRARFAARVCSQFAQLLHVLRAGGGIWGTSGLPQNVTESFRLEETLRLTESKRKAARGELCLPIPACAERCRREAGGKHGSSALPQREGKDTELRRVRKGSAEDPERCDHLSWARLLSRHVHRVSSAQPAFVARALRAAAAFAFCGAAGRAEQHAGVQGRESVFLFVLLCSVKGLILLLLKVVTIVPLISLEERSGNMSKVLLSRKWNKGVISIHLYSISFWFLCRGYLLEVCVAPCTERSRF